LNHVLQVKNDFGTYSTCVLVKEPAAFVFTFPEFRKRVGVTRDAHFDVSRILETWKFRQERGRTGFVRASATNTVVLRSTIEGEMQELKETAYWLELLEGARLCGRDQVEPLTNEADQLMAIFVTIVRKTKAGMAKRKF
jgi:hypothetical protein